jgi:glycosyltransferase involved in cell wall biosynthesis
VRIAYVTDQVLPKTATDTRQTVTMAAALGAAGAQMTLVTPRRWTRRAEASRAEVAAYYEVAPRFEMATQRSLYPGIRGIEKLAQGLAGPRAPAARRADLVYTRTLPILLGALLAGRPVVYETYRPWPQLKPASASFFRWLGRRKNFLGAVLHSRLATDSYAHAGVPREKLLTAHNGYDPSVLEPRRSRTEARRACGLEPGRPTVVYTGRVTMEKGLGLVLEMAAALPKARFVVVGSESSRGRFERQAERRENVRVAPWMRVGETAPYLQAADVLLIPPASGPLREVGNTVLPLKTFLYLAAGRAILAPSTPDLRELLRDGENAALVPPDDAPAATRRLRALLADGDARDRLGEHARADSAELTWDARAQRVLAFLEERLDAARLADGTRSSRD